MSDSSENTFDTDYSPRPVGLAEIEGSLRLPVLHGIMASGCWLLLGTLLQLVSTLQLASPGWFAGCSFLTHGKTSVVADTILVYGFAMQILFSIGIYLSCRLSRKNLRHSFTYHVAAKIWNLGVLLGVIGIFIGDATGHEFLAMPAYATGLLFISFAVMTIKNLLVIHYRADRELYPAQLFQGAGLFWFLWVLATAIVVLQLKPVTGVAQFVVNKWCVNGLFQLVMGSSGIAALFYFLPQVAGRPLHSRELATTTFWTLIFVAGWTGLTGRWPLPAWVSGVSSAAAFMLLVPLVGVAWNLWQTVAPELGRVLSQTSGRFLCVGAASYLLWLFSEFLLGFNGVSQLLRGTHFETAREVLFLYGFVGMTGIGAVCTFLPRMTQVECKCEGSEIVFKAAFVGLVVTVVALGFAGLKQGGALADSSLGFVAVSAAGSGLLKLGVVGMLILTAAAVLFLFGTGTLVARSLYTNYPVLEWMEEEKVETAEKEAA